MNPNHEWARRLKDREKAGEVLPEFSRKAWREVLNKDSRLNNQEGKKQIKQYKPK